MRLSPSRTTDHTDPLLRPCCRSKMKLSSLGLPHCRVCTAPCSAAITPKGVPFRACMAVEIVCCAARLIHTLGADSAVNITADMRMHDDRGKRGGS